MHTGLVREHRFMSARAPLDMDALKKKVPSIFATKASPKMGERYTFIPSLMAVEALHRMGFVPVMASQRNSTDPASARHMIRFARKADLMPAGIARKKGDRLLEMVLSNSHNGRTAYKLFFGIFEVVCANGLIVADSRLAGMNRRHTGDIKGIMEEAEEVLGRTKEVTKRVDAMLKTKMTQPQRLAFADKALHLRWTDKNGKLNAPVTAEDLLVPRRAEDSDTNLWKTFNVIQENLLRGGLDGKSANGRLVHTRDVQDVRKVLTFNTDLWTLAAERIAA